VIIGILKDFGHIRTGAAGVTGASGGVLSYADFYALMPPNHAATVAIGGDVDFPQDGPLIIQIA
jgi:hypothetical protein